MHQNRIFATLKTVAVLRVLKGSMVAQIVFAVFVGVAFGLIFPAGDLEKFSEGGKVVIHWVKLVAGPFLFLTIVASIVEVQMKLQHGLRLIGIALLNTSLAIVIGLILTKLILTGLSLSELPIGTESSKTPEITLSVTQWLKTLMPTSLLKPLVENEILLIALLALAVGIALRGIYKPEGAAKLRQVASLFEAIRKVPEVFLYWLIRIIPLAVLFVVAGSVSKYGLGIFKTLATYVAAIFAGFVIQIVFVYGTWIFGVARMNFKKFWREAKVPVLYSIGVNSSLATLPLTLKALSNLGVSSRSASLGAGVATNLNNDGIVLYEAMAVFFIAHLMGIPMTETQMLIAALTCIVASMGITGIPEAGFISLSVVVATLNLPTEILPLLLAVDWIVARGRTVVNVVSDMTLSIALDATESKS